MSLILDALNRSRDDEHPVPSLATQHDVQERGWNPGHVLLGLALLVAITVIVWLLLAREPSQPEVVMRESATVAPVVPQVSPPEPAASAEPPPEIKTAPLVPAEQPAVEVAPQQENPESDKTAVAVYEAMPDPAISALYQQESAQSQAAGPASVKSQPITEPEPAREEQPVDLEKMLTQAQSDLEDTRLSEHPAPFISALSQQTKDGIPTIFYERHDYSGKKGQSQVVLGGRTVKAGGTLPSGVRVDEILPDSVVLSYKGTQFRLRALNSWVNL